MSRELVGDQILKMAKTIRDELGSIQDLAHQIDRLRAVRDWAINQQPIKSDSRARIANDLRIRKDSGWSVYRECLAVGATGTVTTVDFNSHYGYWYAEFTPDEQWSIGSDGQRYDTHPDRRGQFWIELKYLEQIEEAKEQAA